LNPQLRTEIQSEKQTAVTIDVPVSSTKDWPPSALPLVKESLTLTRAHALSIWHVSFLAKINLGSGRSETKNADQRFEKFEWARAAFDVEQAVIHA
jgi:hypothetical protein